MEATSKELSSQSETHQAVFATGHSTQHAHPALLHIRPYWGPRFHGQPWLVAGQHNINPVWAEYHCVADQLDSERFGLVYGVYG